jgi:tetracycline 7-halogenase / FADH2 O2-dependent halogenase
MSESYDVIILGSGFSGSLLGRILVKRGWKVLVIDLGRHPRFAIGESTTPTADFLIAKIADSWGLPEIAPLACWGSWKREYPDVVCGKKRGFSYYSHRRFETYADDCRHGRSLLVAASREDRYSDTHWLRSSVDDFLARLATDAGVTLWQESSIARAEFDRFEQLWRVGVVRGGDAGKREKGEPEESVRARWIVDASGGGAATAGLVDNGRDDDWMRTRTRATYAHFSGVKPFIAGRADDDPFCGDDAAQHHLVDNGWWWMLRFDNGVTSVGLVERIGGDGQPQRGGSASERLFQAAGEYPSVGEMLDGASVVGPPGGVVASGRMSRCRAAAFGAGWILLPNAYGFVDPLHSTGIAHALSGVDRVARILTGPTDEIDGRLAEYQSQLRAEIRWLDTLIAGCYRAMPSFKRFTAYCGYYFVAAIGFEAVMASDPGVWPMGYMQCGDRRLAEAAEASFREAGDGSVSDDEFVRRVRERIAPWNGVGLLDPANRNRLSHTAAPKYAAIAGLAAGEPERDRPVSAD